MADLIGKATKLAKEGKFSEAEHLLRQLVTTNPNNIQYWIWLERVVSIPEQKLDCLQKIVKLDSNNLKARNKLHALEASLEKKKTNSVQIEQISNLSSKASQVIPSTQQRKGRIILDGNLDNDQLDAVHYRGSNLLIIAGAGSGKTHTITHRAISMLNEIEPENLMIVTFTKRAAKEIADRIFSSISPQQRTVFHSAWIGTIYSICWRILKENSQIVELRPNWSVLDMTDSYQVMGEAAAPFGIHRDREIQDLFQLYCFARNAMMDWRDLVCSRRFPNMRNENNIGKSIERYKRRCHRSNRVDFDELQILSLKLFNENNSICQRYKERFQAIMVDEYHDTNLIQRNILELLDSGTNLTVVGDESQSIYGFRAATLDNILNFEQDFHAHRISIHKNYRSTPDIVDLSNASIANNHQQIHKEISSIQQYNKKPIFSRHATPAEEATYICKEISKLIEQGIIRQNIAVLFRDSRQVATLEAELKKAGMQYKLFGGEDFFSREHIKVILDMVRLLVNPDDSIALASVLSIVGFTNKKLIDQIERIADLTKKSFREILISEQKNESSFIENDFQQLIDFQSMVHKFSRGWKEGQSILPIVSRIINYLIPYYQKRFALTWEEILVDLGVLSDIAESYISLSDFINSLTLQKFQESSSDAKLNPLILTTVHNTKGFEWDIVFIIGLVEFWFPMNIAIQQSGSDEEERRLFYVAVSRAKRQLYMTSYVSSFNPYGHLMDHQISRFIQELPINTYEQQ